MPTTAARIPQPRERIRILYCLDTLQIGGTELNAVKTAERLDRGRFEVTVACLNAQGPLAARYAAAGIPVHEFPAGSLYGRGMVREGVRFLRFLAEFRPHIVHCHDFYSNVFGALWARAARIPVVIASRRWWHTLPKRHMQWANRAADRLAHYVLTNSSTLAAALRDGEGHAAERLLVLPNFVDDAAFAPMPLAERSAMLRAIGVPEGAAVVGCIARLVTVKDLPTLLHAAAELAPEHPDLHLVLVGDGACRGALETLAESLGIRHRVHFAGERPNTPNLHALFDVSVLCSRSEGFPNTIIEAMAAGRPVVASAVGGCVEAVVHGETGLLVPPASPGDLAAAIGELLSSDVVRRRYGSAGRRRARTRYHAVRVIGQLEQMYETLAAGRPA